jgi:hypothetical protein
MCTAGALAEREWRAGIKTRPRSTSVCTDGKGKRAAIAWRGLEGSLRGGLLLSGHARNATLATPGCSQCAGSACRERVPTGQNRAIGERDRWRLRQGVMAMGILKICKIPNSTTFCRLLGQDKQPAAMSSGAGPCKEDRPSTRRLSRSAKFLALRSRGRECAMEASRPQFCRRWRTRRWRKRNERSRRGCLISAYTGLPPCPK